ncbi:hypothetical protein BVRB_2g029420 [Beta vulgaris subsp. vulgaris]|nr:hypothetical protein BVRB_2g029420 [Beta vulgaris subsp. vulgaris]
MFSQFTKDLSIPAGVRIKAINDICTRAKFTDITKNFLVIMAEYGRLRHVAGFTNRFLQFAEMTIWRTWDESN